MMLIILLSSCLGYQVSAIGFFAQLCNLITYIIIFFGIFLFLCLIFVGLLTLFLENTSGG